MHAALRQDLTSEDFKMKQLNISHGFRAALIGLAVIGAAGIARADIKDYEFKLVEPTVAVGKDKIITVRLIHKTTGKPVPDAVIFATRLDMAPEGMPEMATKIVREPGGEPGSYRFKAAFGMEGKWQLSLGAKVQGETGTVESKLVITAQK
jgi:YtkA-like